jgi:hypothetical protein
MFKTVSFGKGRNGTGKKIHQTTHGIARRRRWAGCMIETEAPLGPGRSSCTAAVSGDPCGTADAGVSRHTATSPPAPHPLAHVTPCHHQTQSHTPPAPIFILAPASNRASGLDGPCAVRHIQYYTVYNQRRLNPIIYSTKRSR